MQCIKTCNGVPSYLLQIASIIIFQLIIEGFWSEVAKIKNILTKNWLIAKNYLK